MIQIKNVLTPLTKNNTFAKMGVRQGG